MSTRAGLGTILRNSYIVRFVQGGVVKTFRCATKALKYNLLYIVAEEVSLKTKGLSGTITLQDDRVHIDGPDELSIPYSQFEDLRIFRQHKLGTLIHCRCAATSVFLTVPRINLFGVFAVINHNATHSLFAELQRRSNPQRE